MDIFELFTHIVSFIFGGVAGSLITVKIRSDSNVVSQKNITTNNGDIVGRDKK